MIKFVIVWLETDLWFSPGPPVSSTNKTDRHDITEILLKVALSTIKQKKTNKQTERKIQRNYARVNQWNGMANVIVEWINEKL